MRKFTIIVSIFLCLALFQSCESKSHALVRMLKDYNVLEKKWNKSNEESDQMKDLKKEIDKLSNDMSKEELMNAIKEAMN